VNIKCHLSADRSDFQLRLVTSLRQFQHFHTSSCYGESCPLRMTTTCTQRL